MTIFGFRVEAKPEKRLFYWFSFLADFFFRQASYNSSSQCYWPYKYTEEHKPRVYRCTVLNLKTLIAFIIINFAFNELKKTF